MSRQTSFGMRIVPNFSFFIIEDRLDKTQHLHFLTILFFNGFSYFEMRSLWWWKQNIWKLNTNIKFSSLNIQDCVLLYERNRKENLLLKNLSSGRCWMLSRWSSIRQASRGQRRLKKTTSGGIRNQPTNIWDNEVKIWEFIISICDYRFPSQHDKKLLFMKCSLISLEWLSALYWLKFREFLWALFTRLNIGFTKVKIQLNTMQNYLLQKNSLPNKLGKELMTHFLFLSTFFYQAFWVKGSRLTHTMRKTWKKLH